MIDKKEQQTQLPKSFSFKFSRRLSILLLGLATLILSCISIILKPLPLFWVLLSVSLFMMFLFKKSGQTFYKVLNFNFGAIFFILAVFEVIFTFIDDVKKLNDPVIAEEHVYDNIPDDVVGNKLIKNTTRNARKFIDGQLLYDVIITVDSNSLRKSPPCISPCSGAVLFFGDSYTFGEGVNDEEAMPYKVGLALNNKYAVYNFAAPGYGTHQILSIIEHGMVNGIVKENAGYAIYQVIYPDHIRRMRGQWNWDKHGPWYELDKNNKPVLQGFLADKDKKNRLRFLQEYSMIANKIINFKRPLNKYDKNLFIAILARSLELLRKSYPDIEFHIVIWDLTYGKDKKIFDALRDKGFQLHFIRDILREDNLKNLKYRLSKHDCHPNSLTHSLLAKYVTDSIIKQHH